ncbi:hypothetical protein LCGC14_2705550 [marine sediment metagenome]|uniref:Uncharacterized protein n=1 Tax=marine sediment metagenome TaxID=412755 RepID=A0A0F8ZED1_9ZZZZ
MIRGNHPMVTYNKNESSVEYLEHTDIKVVEDIVIDNMYFGHKMTEKSNMAFGLVVPSISRYEVLVEDLKKYRYSFLGHQHQFQVIDENIYHPGAIIYNTFGEVHSKGRYIVKMKEKPFIIQLETPIPMVDIIDIKHLDQIYEDCEEQVIQGCEFYLRGLESGYEHRKLTIIDIIDEEIAKYPLLFQEAIQALTELKNKI